MNMNLKWTNMNLNLNLNLTLKFDSCCLSCCFFLYEGFGLHFLFCFLI